MIKKIILALIGVLLCSAALVPTVHADEKGAGTGLPAQSAALTVNTAPPSISKTTGQPVPPSACDWNYKQHPWNSVNDQRVFFAQGGPQNHYYEAFVSHEIQTAIDLNNVCASQIRNATDMTCWYRTTAIGTNRASSCGGVIMSRLAIKNSDGSYDRVNSAERYFEFFSTTGRPTLYSKWTNWTNDCWLPMTEVDRIDFHGDVWYLSDPANYYPLGCTVPYHPGV